MSKIRLWTLGQITDNPKTTFIPTQKMIGKLRNILTEMVNSGTTDLVFGPMPIKCQVIDEAVSDNILVPVEKREDGTILYKLMEDNA